MYARAAVADQLGAMWLEHDAAAKREQRLREQLLGPDRNSENFNENMKRQAAASFRRLGQADSEERGKPSRLFAAELEAQEAERDRVRGESEAMWRSMKGVPSRE